MLLPQLGSGRSVQCEQVVRDTGDNQNLLSPSTGTHASRNHRRKQIMHLARNAVQFRFPEEFHVPDIIRVERLIVPEPTRCARCRRLPLDSQCSPLRHTQTELHTKLRAFSFVYLTVPLVGAYLSSASFIMAGAVSLLFLHRTARQRFPQQTRSRSKPRVRRCFHTAKLPLRRGTLPPQPQICQRR